MFYLIFRELVERIPQLSVFEIYQKLHDTILLNKIDFEKADRSDPYRLEFIFSRLLKEFHETVVFNPKEWILMRDLSREEHYNFRTEINPFYEPYCPVVHNIIVDCGYTSKDLVVKYEGIEEEIPLKPPNKMMADPRIMTNKTETKKTEVKKPEAKKPMVKKTVVKKTGVKKPEVNKIEVKKPEPKITVTTKTTPVVRKVIKIPKTNSYLNEIELKKIVRRVSISSDESSNED